MLFDSLQAEILQLLKTSLKDSLNETDLRALILETPPEMEMGDFAFPTFKLAHVLKKSPLMIAADLVKKIGTELAINKTTSVKYQVTQAGPYVNFTVKQEILTSEVLSSLLLGQDKPTKPCGGKNIVVEFSSPNVAKTFNIYHLRSTMIGNSICRILRERGFNPIAINHLGDWGTQYGTLLLAFMKWGDETELKARGIVYLVDLYVRINKEMEQATTLMDEARALFTKLEQGDQEVRKLWQKFVDLSLEEFQSTYKRLDVEFDYYWGESFYVHLIPKLEKELAGKGLLVASEGAQVVMLKEFGMPPCIIKKADGSSIYATRDIAAAIYRHEKFQFSKMIYIVGTEQKLHFAQVFRTLDLMGYDWAKACCHADFGLYRFADEHGSSEKMSTRKGRFVTLKSVLDEAVKGARRIIDSKHDADMTDAEKKTAAEIIGAGAVIFNDLSTDRLGDVNFDLERVLDFNGETGPYIQYAHTRCLSILRNAPEDLVKDLTADIANLNNPTQQALLIKTAGTHLIHKEELDLLRTLARLPIVLDDVLECLKPNLLANFLITVTKSFNAFYRAHKVLVDDKSLALARLALVLATQRTLLKGLTLLGISTPEKM